MSVGFGDKTVHSCLANQLFRVYLPPTKCSLIVVCTISNLKSLLRFSTSKPQA